MRSRRRGQNTQDRILKAACAVFAEYGYRDATHAEICRRAETNVASINYYFGSKEDLYRAVFQHLTERADRLYPLDGNLPPAAMPEERLKILIRAHLDRMFDPERMGDLHKIRMAELFDSTGLLKEPLRRQLAKDREYTQRVLRDLMGPRASQRKVELCEMSIISQCFIGAPGKPGRGPRDIFKLRAGEVTRLVDHILKFSLAGVRAVCRQGGNPADDERKRTGSTR